MAEFPALPLFTDAYFGDTRHLSCTEHGAYLQLLMIAWRTKTCDLPDDDVILAKYVGLRLDHWRRIAPTIRAFFVAEGGRLYQKRLRDELNYCERLRDNQVRAGRASALKRKDRHSTALQRRFNGASTPTPTPTPSILLPTVEEKKPSVQKSGSRLPSDWHLPEEWGQWAWREFRWQREAIIEEGAAFRDYWVGKAGAAARKADWEATWRNWCRRSNRPKHKPGGAERMLI